MSTYPLTLRRDACPGVIDAMQAADGMLMRVLLPGGAVSGVQLDVIAAVASAHGNGIIEVTARANLQIRGIEVGCVAAAADALIRSGLAERDPSINARRAIVAPALAGHDPLAAADATPFVIAITEQLRAADLLGELPAKFAVVVDDHSPHGVADLTGHIVITIRPDDTPERVADFVVGAARALAAARPVDPIERDRGAAPIAFTGPAVGVHDHVEAGQCNVIAAAAFGRVDSAQLRALTGLCHHGSLRFTHRRGVAIAGVPRSALSVVLDQLGAAGLSADPTDPVHFVTACAGSPGCASSRANTLAAAAALISDRVRHGDRGQTERVHFSGCEKLCGAPVDARHVVADHHGLLQAES